MKLKLSENVKNCFFRLKLNLDKNLKRVESFIYDGLIGNMHYY
jgi:hypothetical protein